MASIPLPALHVQTPEDPTGNLTRLVALRQQLQMAPLQRQAMQQQVEAGGQENQLRQLQIQDQQTLRQSAKDLDWSKPDTFDKWIDNATQKGVSPQTLSQLSLQRAQYKEQLAKTDTAELGAMKESNNQFLGHIDAIKGVTDPQKRAQAAQDQASQILSNPQLAKRLDPTTQQMLLGMKSGQAVPNDDQLGQFEIGLTDHNAQIEQQLKVAQTGEAVSKGKEAEAQAAKANAEVQNTSGPLAEARYRRVLSDLSANKQVSDADLQFAKGFELSSRKTTTQSDTLGVTSTNTSTPSGLAAVGNRQGGRFIPQAGAVPPAAAVPGAPGAGAPAAAAPAAARPAAAGAASPANTKDSIVDMIGQYKLNPTVIQRMTTKHPEILAAVGQKYPDFDQTTYNAKNKLITGFTSGPQSKEINAINTVAGHLDELDQAVDALNNTRVPVLNALANKLGVAIGDTPQTTFRTIVHRVGPEITGAYVAGGGGETERLADAADFSENNAPDQLHKNVGETVKLLRSKIGALENQYQNTVGRQDFQQRFITPSAQAAFTRLAGTQGGGANQSGGRQGGPPPGATHIVPGRDGKNHYTNATGTVDLGIAP